MIVRHSHTKPRSLFCDTTGMIVSEPSVKEQVCLGFLCNLGGCFLRQEVPDCRWQIKIVAYVDTHMHMISKLKKINCNRWFDPTFRIVC